MDIYKCPNPEKILEIYFQEKERFETLYAFGCFWLSFLFLITKILTMYGANKMNDYFKLLK